MNVYLPQLDSVRNSVWEIKRGQWELFRQIEHNGTTVVLTMNQLTDSIAFTDILWDEKCYEAITAFFNLGRIKVSQYGEIWTASQYLQNALEKDRTFKFSGIPVCEDKTTPFKANEKQLLLESLKFSDLNRLAIYKKQAETEEERLRIDYLYRYIKLILHISSKEEIWIPPKASFKKMSEWITAVCENYESAELYNPETDAIWFKSREILLRGLKEINKSALQSRSEWYNYIKAFNGDREYTNHHSCFAEAVVDICYNISCEGSISLIERENGFSQFQEELIKYWDTYINGHHIFNSEADCEKNEKSFEAELPPFSSAAEILNDVEQISDFETTDLSFEEKIKKTKKKFRNKKIKSSILRFMVAVGSVAIFVFLDFLSGKSQEFINLKLPFSDNLENIIMSVIFGIVLAVLLNLLIPFLTKIILHSKTYEMDYLDVFKHLFSRSFSRHKINSYKRNMRKDFNNELE